jgi:hypothetical protein
MNRPAQRRGHLMLVQIPPMLRRTTSRPIAGLRGVTPVRFDILAPAFGQRPR